MGVAFDGARIAAAGRICLHRQRRDREPGCEPALTLHRLRSAAERRGRSAEIALRPHQAGPRPSISRRITGSIAGENVTGTAHFDLGGAKTRFALSGSAGTISLPSLLGVLVAWHRTPSTEEMLGAIGSGASEVWPSRGFSLGPIEQAEGEITLKANTLIPRLGASRCKAPRSPLRSARTDSPSPT